MLVDELLSTPLINRLKCFAVRWKPPSQDETPLQYFSSSKLLNRCVESCPSIPSLLIATILGPEALPGSARATRAKRSYTWEQDTAWFFTGIPLLEQCDGLISSIAPSELRTLSITSPLLFVQIQDDIVIEEGLWIPWLLPEREARSPWWYGLGCLLFTWPSWLSWQSRKTVSTTRMRSLDLLAPEDRRRAISFHSRRCWFSWISWSGITIGVRSLTGKTNQSIHRKKPVWPSTQGFTERDSSIFAPKSCVVGAVSIRLVIS